MEKNKCRICGGETYLVLSLGEMYPSTFIKSSEDYNKLKKEPLELMQCEDCSLVQLGKAIELDDMYRQYWYRSNLNKSMVNDLEDVAESALKIHTCIHTQGGVVLDIGCNDGTLFKFFPDDYFKIGVDPAFNLINEAKENCDVFINDYFSADDIDRKANIITSIAMFYDLPDPNLFVDDIRKTLADDGVWVIQFTDLYSMMKINAFDNICFEHLEYYTLLDVIQLLRKHSLEVFNVERNEVNGGSLRVYASHAGEHLIFPKVFWGLANETSFLRSKEGSIDSFRERIKTIKKSVTNFIEDEVKNNKIIHVLGASTKGNTLLQVLNLDKNLISYAAEVNEDKFGLFTVGSDLEIISEKESLGMNPDYYLVLPWHFRDSLLQKRGIANYLESGGKLIFPLPILTVLSKDSEFVI